MVRTLNSDLLAAQAAGYPTGEGYDPAVRCIFTSGATTHDYSFNPTVTTNRLIHVQQIEGRDSDSGMIRLSNYDRAIPANLTGYYVDIGWGHNTASGVLPSSTVDAGAVSPRMWVMYQSAISGGPKNSPNKYLYTDLAMSGVWGAVLNKQPFLLGTSPLHRYSLEDALDLANPLYIIPALTGLTIYYVLKYLIETGLSDQTGVTFTLDDLGTQDDGQINSVIPFPATEDPEELLRTINEGSPWYFDTYGDVIGYLLQLTKCILAPRVGLAFRIMYPQASDTADVTYYDSISKGHPFYEAENRRLSMIPNHIEVFGGEDEVTGLPLYSGHWFDTDHYSGWVSPETTATYTGSFMPVKASGSTDNELWETGFQSDAECVVRAAELGWQLKDQILGLRIIVPMDASVELYDRVEVRDRRGI